MRRGEENDTADVCNDRDPDRCLCDDGVRKMKYKIELTEKQMQVVEKCTELYMRLMMGQTRDLADELAFYNVAKYQDRDDFHEIHGRICNRRNDLQEVLAAAMRIAFPTPYHVPEDKTEDGMIAECIWDAVRYARGNSRWSQPFQIGSEPVPKIKEVEE